MLFLFGTINKRPENSPSYSGATKISTTTSSPPPIRIEVRRESGETFEIAKEVDVVAGVVAVVVAVVVVAFDPRPLLAGASPST